MKPNLIEGGILVKVTNSALAAKSTILKSIGYYAAHVALIGLGIVECMLANDYGLVATIIAAFVFILAAAFDAVTGDTKQGWTAATLSYAFGQLMNWLWYTCWPQDFESMSNHIVFAVLFAIFGAVIQMLMIWDDNT